MFQWCHDLFSWESLHMHLVTWAEVIALSGDAKVDTLVTPFAKGEIAPGAYYVTYIPACVMWFM